MHCDGIPEDHSPKLTKSAFELDITAEALQDGGSPTDEETTAFLPGPNDLGNHATQANVVGAQQHSVCQCREARHACLLPAASRFGVQVQL